MPKLTKAQKRSIETALYYLEKAQAFINEEATIIARTKYMKTTTLDFDVPGKGVASSIAKDIGSNLDCLSTGIYYLNNFVKMNSKE